MKILITDDQARRYARLLEALVELGVARNQVDIAHSASEARTFLEANKYDLLVLDILLPLWPEQDDDANTKHSLDLLMELHEGDSLQKPGRVLGITGDLAVAGEAAAQFDKWTWSVVEYSESNDDWIHRVVACVRYIKNEAAQASTEKPEHKVDLAIICALAKPELEEVLRLNWNWSPPRPIDDVTFVHDGFLECAGRKITVCAVAAPRMGMVASALTSASVISLLRPRLIAMCGVCAGVKGKVNLGDVLLAEPAWDFQSGKRVRDKENAQFSVAPHQLYTSSVIRTHVEQVREDRTALAKIATDFGSDASGLTKVVIGPVASGSAVLADGDVVKEIKQQHRELIGIEMEAYGIYAAAHAASSPQPRAFALKAVCDFADPDKEDKHQRYAAYASANVLRLLMEKYGTRLLD